MSNKKIPPEKARQVFYDALYGGDVKSIVQLLGWFDRRRLSAALRRLKYQQKKGSMGKIEKYMESIFLNSAKIDRDKNGKRHVELIKTNKVVGYVVSYYFSNSISPSLKGKIKKSAFLVRKRMLQRFYQMPEEKLQHFLASREEKHEG